MYPYFLLLSLPALGTILGKSRPSPWAYGAAFVFFALFVGLRDGVGPDWIGYTILHWKAALWPLSKILSESEPLSILLFKFSQLASGDMLISNLVAALILIFGVFSFAKRTPQPWLAILSATPYLIIAFGMSGIRQAMAIGIVMYVLSKWDRWGLVSKSFVVVVGALFHSSALVGGLFILLDLPIKRNIKIALMVPLTLAVLYTMQSVSLVSESLELYNQRYLGSSQVASLGSLFHIALIVIPAFLALLTRRSIEAHVVFPKLLTYGVVASLGLVIFNFVSSTGASRLSLYLYFVPMMVYPAWVSSIAQSKRSAMKLAMVAMHILILFAWLQFANNASSHLPYKSVLI